jgi:small subunit ribosomal protein S4e
MGRKGNSRHISRLASSRYVHVMKKTSAYVSKQRPGRHTLATSIALITVLKEKINLVKNSAEARSVIKKGAIKVNGKVVKDERYPVGFGDIIDVEPSKETFAVDVAKHGVVKVEKAAAQNERTLKVIGKYVAKGNKIMIRLHDGTTMNGNKEVKVNDSVEVKNGKIEKVLRFEKGANCYVVHGEHASENGILKEIKAGTATRVPTVEVESAGKKFETLVGNVMVIGK